MHQVYTHHQLRVPINQPMILMIIILHTDVKNAPPDDYMTHMTRPVWVDMSGATRRKCFDLVQRCAFLSHDQSQHRCLADLGGVVEHGTHLNLDGGFKCSPLFGEDFQFDYFSDGL